MPTRKTEKRTYAAPRVVDFGSIEVMTGDCIGLCMDALNAGFYLLEP